jgi:hypothetical protein
MITCSLTPTLNLRGQVVARIKHKLIILAGQDHTAWTFAVISRLLEQATSNEIHYRKECNRVSYYKRPPSRNYPHSCLGHAEGHRTLTPEPPSSLERTTPATSHCYLTLWNHRSSTSSGRYIKLLTLLK